MAKPTTRPGLRAQRVDDGLVVLDPATGVAHHLNETASVVWSACDGSRSVEDIVEELADTYDAEREVVRRDVLQILERLRALELLTH